MDAQIILPIMLIVGIGLAGYGGFLQAKAIKKSKMIECTYCKQVMKKSEFEDHKSKHRLEQIESLQDRTMKEKVAFKSWVLTEVDKKGEFNLGELMREGAIKFGISRELARIYLYEMMEGPKKEKGKDGV